MISLPPQPAPALVGPDGEPVESDHLKQERQHEAVRNLFARYAQQQLVAVANHVLEASTRTTRITLNNIVPLKPGATRLSFSLAFQLRGRFLVTSAQPPSWVHDPHKPIGKRRRREIIRQFREASLPVRHHAANRIISDVEYAGSILDSWRANFEGGVRGEQPAHRGDDRPSHTGSAASAEVARESDVSLRDAPLESSTTQSFASEGSVIG